MTPKEYLELCLKNGDDSSNKEILSKNIYRDIIKKNFKNRDAYTLVIPTTDEQKIKNLENENRNILRTEFLQQVDEMINLIKTNIPEKKINNVLLDGEALFGLLQSKIC
jgi:hypothetical protein